MQYVVSLTVPKNTPQSKPLSVEIIPQAGSIERGRIMFPLNAAGLLGARLLDRDQQFMPAPNSPTGWVTGDGVTIEWEEDRQLTGPPYRMLLQAYNLDDTYNRTIELRLEIVQQSMRSMMAQLIGELGRLSQVVASARR